MYKNYGEKIQVLLYRIQLHHQHFDFCDFQQRVDFCLWVWEKFCENENFLSDKSKLLDY